MTESDDPVTPILIGAAVGAGTAAATGGDVGKGALFGAVGGGVGAIAAPAVGITQASILGASVTPATFGAIGGGVAGGLTSKAFSKKIDPVTGTSSVTAPTTAKKTAAPISRLSAAATRNRQRKAAFQPRGFAPPTLGQAGLLGVSG